MAGIIPKFKKGPNTVGQRTSDDLWTRTGTFINKPVHGWLHPEEKLKHGGICYGVRVSLNITKITNVHPLFQFARRNNFLFVLIASIQLSCPTAPWLLSFCAGNITNLGVDISKFFYQFSFLRFRAFS